MSYFDVIFLCDVISSIGPNISEADTYIDTKQQQQTNKQSQIVK